MTTGSRRIGLIALAFAVILLGSMAALSAVSPSAGYFALTVAGNLWGDTTAVYGNRTAAAVVYLDGSSSGYGVVSDSRPTEATVAATEIFFSQDATTAALSGYNLRRNGPLEFRHYSGTFPTVGTDGTGSVTAGYATMPTGGTITFAMPSELAQGTVFTGDTGVIGVAVRDTIVSFAGLNSARVFGKLIAKANAPSCSHVVRVYLFSDSAGYKSMTETSLYYHNVSDSALMANVSLDTRCWNRIYVEGRRRSDSAPVFMKRFDIFAAEAQTGDSSSTVQNTLKFTLGNVQADTFVIDTGTFNCTFVLGVSRIVNANVARLLRADSNTGIIVGETNAATGLRRLTGTTKTIAFVDTAGAVIDPSTGRSVSYTVDLKLLGYALNDTGSVTLASLDPALLEWRSVASTISPTGILSASVTKQGIYALVHKDNPTLVSQAGGGCVIDATVGRTGFAGVMPALRSARDMVLGSSFGRLFVSGYYGFAAILMIAAVGFGTTLVSEKK